MSAELEKISPADICLEKAETWVGAYDNQVKVLFEHRAWVCPYCGQSTEYWLANGCVIMGSGKSMTMRGGKTSDCCERYQCREDQNKWHNSKERQP
jgi:hypothetical protein